MLGNKVYQEQETIQSFPKKFHIKKIITDKLMIIARIESLILGKPLTDALKEPENTLMLVLME